jgi:murein DD-endopeptidase MepM/ murein hydrolase activator NlpD
MTDWRTFYKKVSNPFHAPSKIYSGWHHGADFPVAAHGVVPAYFSGECVKLGFTPYIGYYAVFHADGAFLSYAHLLVGTRPDVGQHVKPGDRVGLAAGRGDEHGTQWTGPHCHTTRGSDINSIYNGNTVDPVPRIRALTGTAPHPDKLYLRVRPGEGGIKVAARAGITFTKLEALNPGVNMSKLRLAQKLRIR